MHTLRSGQVRFGAFQLDLGTGELWSPQTPDPNNKVLLREQVFQVLRMLLEREGQIVTREDIKEKLWPDDTVVDFDSSINATIKTLRRALGDSADHPRYIETLARRGYRLMPRIEYPELLLPGTAVGDSREQGDRCAIEIHAKRVRRRINLPGWKAVLALASVLLLILAGYISWRHLRAAAVPKTGKTMLAVLPFENLTGDPSKEYLADGLTEETISQLGRLNPEHLGVIARTSVMGYKHKDEHLDQIGRDLSVQYVLENSLRESGDHMRLTAQLIQVKDQTHLWSQDYDYQAMDILKVEDEVASAVARAVQLHLTSPQQAELPQLPPVNPDAFDAYLQGYYFFERNTDKDTETALKYFERATQLDPSYALPWVWVSRIRNFQVNVSLIPHEEGRREAREAIERALALNPNLAEAHIQMGRIKEQADFDWAGANTSFQRAIALEPGNPEALRLAADSAVYLGRFDDALQLDRRAVDLDPLNADSWEGLGETELFMGHLDQAAADMKKAIGLNPDVWGADVRLSQTYVLQARPEDALAQIEGVRYAPHRAYLYALTYYALGRQEEADAALSELIAKYHANMAYQVAEVYAFRNESDKALEWLNRAYAQRDSGLIETKVDPFLKSLHKDPRYTAFLKKLNFPS